MSISAQRTVFGHLSAPKVSKLGWRRALLGCGVAAALLYVGMDLLAAWRYDGYSYTDRTISELSAVVRLSMTVATLQLRARSDAK
jgi:hypothetical protein